MRWKQFAIDFDEVPLPDKPGKPPPAEDSLHKALQSMRVSAASKRLDMTDAFEEYAGTGTEKNSGIMAKNRFRSTMGEEAPPPRPRAPTRPPVAPRV